MRLSQGTAGTLIGFLYFSQPTPEAFMLDVDDQATATQLTAGSLRVDSSLVVGYARLGDLDVDPAVVGFDSPDLEGQYLRETARGHVIVSSFAEADDVLRGPWTDLPDLRFVPLSAAAATPCPSVGMPFFEPVTYCGATGAATPFGIIPWFEPAPVVPFTKVPLNPEPALLTVLVAASNAAQTPLPGVLLSGTTDGVTGKDGRYRSYVPTGGGGAAFVLSNLPPGCSTDGIQFILGLAPREERSTGILVQC